MQIPPLDPGALSARSFPAFLLAVVVAQRSPEPQLGNIFELKDRLLALQAELGVHDDGPEDLAQGFDLAPVERRDGAVRVAQGGEEDALAGHEGPVVPVSRAGRVGAEAERVGQVVAVEPARVGLEKGAARERRRLVLQTADDVVGQHARRLGRRDLVHQQRLHHAARAGGGFEVRRRSANVVRDQAPQRDVVDDFLLAQEDALARQRQVDDGGGEGADRGDAVQVVDRDAVVGDRVVRRPRGREGHDAFAHGGVQEPHAQRAGEAGAAGLDALQRLGALEDVLRRLEQPVPCHFDAEAARARKHLDHPVRAHAAQQRLVRQPRQRRRAVAVEHVLAPRDLRPVDPRRDGRDFVPQGLEFGVLRMLVLQEEVEILLQLGRR